MSDQIVPSASKPVLPREALVQVQRLAVGLMMISAVLAGIFGVAAWLITAQPEWVDTTSGVFTGSVTVFAIVAGIGWLVLRRWHPDDV